MADPDETETVSERELAALADGSLPPKRRVEAERRVAASPRLQALVAEQRHAVDVIRSVSVEAPSALRARLRQDVRERSPGRRRAFAIAVPAAVAAAAAVLVLAVAGGGQSAPSSAAIASLDARGASAPAPAKVAAHPMLLAISTDGVPYPNLQPHYGWRPTGWRTDRLNGRRATTVYYERSGQRIAYTIVSGAPVPAPRGASLHVSEGTRVLAFTAGARTAVTWQRLGHTCVLSGTSTSTAALVDLASYHAGGAIPF